MAKAKTEKTVKSAEELQRPAAEILFADELAKLEKQDAKTAKPQGWRMTPRSVLDFVSGNKTLGIEKKFYGSRSFLERCIVALATNRGLMLIGEPGTAKSYLSELLCAAISGDSTLTVQGSAGTTEDNIKYGWNYALLLAEGPSEKSLVPGPVHRGMAEGKLVRFEEITRCPLEIQDTLLSILSDRVMSMPELPKGQQSHFARVGFNVIATANTRDRGVNEMSAALKRRFNFETVHPISDLKQEMELVAKQTEKMLSRAGIPITLTPEISEVLVTTFHELRSGRSTDGKSLEGLSTVMSTAEAVSVGFAAGIHAYYYSDDQRVGAPHIVNSLIGSALKDSDEDLKKLRNYFRHVVKSKKGSAWEAYFEAGKSIS